MKLTCTLENLKKAVYSTERVVGKQITLPILENVLLETEKGMLKISSTNLEIGVFLKIGAKVEKEGKITAPAKLLSNFINNLPSVATISLEVKDQILFVASDGYKATIKGLSAQEFPIIPEMSSDFLFSFTGQQLKEAIPKLLTCASLDNTRVELGGVNFILGEKEISLAATDSFRLLEVVLPLLKVKNDQYLPFIKKIKSVIVPANTLAEVFRIIDPETKEVQVVIEENQIFFQIDNVRIVSRLINGKYPEYKQIIPAKFATSILLEKEETLRTVKIASFFTNSKAGEVAFKVQSANQNIEVKAQSEDKGENITQLKGKIQGPDQELIFNPRYILDGINAVSGLRFRLSINNNASPAVLQLVKGEKNEPAQNFTYVIMPIKK